MHVYTFCHTNNVACNIQPKSDVCVAIDKHHRLKLRSCYATWRTSPVKEVIAYGYVVRIITLNNSIYSLVCASVEEAHELAEAIQDKLG